ncbi:MAG: NlpC/P60 family protein [Phenylobacterium sp.]
MSPDGAAAVLACAAPIATLRAEPSCASAQNDELLFGELFTVLEAAGEWRRGRAHRDGYEGWVPAAALAEARDRPTHRVAATLAHAFAEPDVRSPARGPYPLNALMAWQGREGRFVDVAGAGWLAADALAPIGRFETDFVTVAERLVGAPYLWGGRSAVGVDCSGLVQAALFACGRACPRDSDQQLAALGRDIEAAAFGRGDLVFWRGHVAIGLSPERVLHANAAAMAVSAEPLDQLIARNRGVYGEPVAWRRL